MLDDFLKEQSKMKIQEVSQELSLSKNNNASQQNQNEIVQKEENNNEIKSGMLEDNQLMTDKSQKIQNKTEILQEENENKEKQNMIKQDESQEQKIVFEENAKQEQQIVLEDAKQEQEVVNKIENKSIANQESITQEQQNQSKVQEQKQEVKKEDKQIKVVKQPPELIKENEDPENKQIQLNVSQTLIQEESKNITLINIKNILQEFEEKVQKLFEKLLSQNIIELNFKGKRETLPFSIILEYFSQIELIPHKIQHQLVETIFQKIQSESSCSMDQTPMECKYDEFAEFLIEFAVSLFPVENQQKGSQVLVENDENENKKKSIEQLFNYIEGKDKKEIAIEPELQKEPEIVQTQEKIESKQNMNENQKQNENQQNIVNQNLIQNKQQQQQVANQNQQRIESQLSLEPNGDLNTCVTQHQGLEALDDQFIHEIVGEQTMENKENLIKKIQQNEIQANQEENKQQQEVVQQNQNIQEIKVSPPPGSTNEFQDGANQEVQLKQEVTDDHQTASTQDFQVMNTEVQTS